MAAPVLNLDSLVDRPTVVINGRHYWMVNIDMLPPLDLHRLIAMQKQIDGLIAKSERGEPLEESDQTRLSVLPDEICRMVLEAPDDVHLALDDRKRMLIAKTALQPSFLMALQAPPSTGETTPAAASPSTGESGSPA